MLNAFKLLAKGVIEKAKTFKGDWNEFDSSSPNYIKNRPFYSNFKEITLFNNKYIELIFYSELNMYASSNFQSINLLAGDQITVLWNNVEYNCIVQALDDYDVYAGDLNHLNTDDAPSYEYPFILMSNVHKMAFASKFDTTASVVIKKEQESIKKIDVKYLPDVGVGRKGNGENSAIFNDYINNKADGYHSIAGGSRTEVFGSDSFAHGFLNNVEGDSSAAFGQSNYIMSDCSFAAGDNNGVDGYKSTAFGFDNYAEHDFTTVIGNGLHTSAPYQHVIGSRNLDDENAIFILGNGDIF